MRIRDAPEGALPGQAKEIFGGAETSLRELSEHRLDDDSDPKLRIIANTRGHESGLAKSYTVGVTGKWGVSIDFKSVGKENGVTEEALLAIVIDRLRAHQKGPFRCDQNRQALDLAERTLLCLHDRTEDRRHRGVEGRERK